MPSYSMHTSIQTELTHRRLVLGIRFSLTLLCGEMAEKLKEATPKRRVATKKESTPESELPISPKEKAQIKETVAR